MNQQNVPHPNYMAVFYSLIVLTAAEVAAAMVPIPRVFSVSALLILAFAKASLVALYFMHLKYERRSLYVVVVGPLVLAFLLMLIPTLDVQLIR